MGIEKREDKRLPPALSFKARIFVALVGISAVTSLIIGLVLYYFAQDRLVYAENTLLKQRSQTANAGARAFLEGLRDPEDQTLPPENPERLGPVLSRHYPITLRCQYDGRDLQERRVIIDQQDRFVQSDSLHPENIQPASTAPETILSYPIPGLLRNSNLRRKTCNGDTQILY